MEINRDFSRNQPSKFAFIYGAGNIGKDVARVLKKNGIPITGFFDQSANLGATWESIPICPPNYGQLSIADREKSLVIVAIHNRESEIGVVIQRLKAAGFGQVMGLVEFYDFFSIEMGDRFWLTARSKYQDWNEEIQQARNLWSDDKSLEIYNKLLQFRLSGDYNCLPSPDCDHQYFSPDVPSWKSPLRFVDCGAYNGDTLQAFSSNSIPIEKAVLFEPDLVNFHRLSEFLSNQWQTAAFAWPCGVSSSSGYIKFNCNQDESSKISEDGNTMIQVVALDDVLHGFRPNLIKMDIEGAEMEALIGARRIIHESRPGLAISVYHRPTDLWQIPLLIKEWDLGYQFYLRLHGFNGFDTVLYALPGES